MSQEDNEHQGDSTSKLADHPELAQACDFILAMGHQVNVVGQDSVTAVGVSGAQSVFVRTEEMMKLADDGDDAVRDELERLVARHPDGWALLDIDTGAFSSGFLLSYDTDAEVAVSLVAQAMVIGPKMLALSAAMSEMQDLMEFGGN